MFTQCVEKYDKRVSVVQDVKEIAGSVKKSVSHLREEFQPEEKPAHLPGEIPDHDEKELSDGSEKELDAGLGVRLCPVSSCPSSPGRASVHISSSCPASNEKYVEYPLQCVYRSSIL